jgi:hypothetical protein
MKVIKIKVFEFQELPIEIQKKAIERYREVLPENIWWYDIVIDNFKERLSRLGYSDIQCFFSGFYSQGDGASFEAKYHYEEATDPDNFGERLKKLQEKYNHNLRGRIIRTSSNYSHDYTMIVDYLESDYVSAEEEDIVEEEDIEEFKIISRELARVLYMELEKEYDYLISNSGITNYFIESGMFFYKDGKIYEDLQH